MKTLLVFVSVVTFSLAPAIAADGSVPANSLTKMGLGAMKTLSDREGTAIRGQLAIAFSHSSVTGGTSFTIVNKPIGQHFAISITGAVGNGLFAGGGAVAIAH